MRSRTVLVSLQFDLADVKSRAGVEVLRREAVEYRAGGLGAAGRTGEGRERAVASALDEPSVEAIEPVTHDPLVALELRAPCGVSDPGELVG